VAALKPDMGLSIPTVSSFSASPASIIAGQSTTLSWVVSGNPAPTTSLSPGGPVTGSSVTVSPTTTTTYTLTATNSQGSAAKSVTVPVNPPADTTPPTVPVNLGVTSISPTSITLSWSASTDPDSAVAGYQIFRNGAPVATSTGVTFTDNNLSPKTSYSYTVAA